MLQSDERLNVLFLFTDVNLPVVGCHRLVAYKIYTAHTYQTYKTGERKKNTKYYYYTYNTLVNFLFVFEKPLVTNKPCFKH